MKFSLLRQSNATHKPLFMTDSRLVESFTTSNRRYEYSPKKGTAFTLTAEALVRRLVALLPPARLHLTSHHGAFAPNARLRPLVTQKKRTKELPKPGDALESLLPG